MAKRNRPRTDDDQLTLDLRVKWCPACCRELPGWDFPPNKNQKQGLAGYCYSCWRVKQRAYFSKRMEDPAFREQRQKKWRAWQQNNQELVKEYARRYRSKHRVKMRESCRAWRLANPDTNRAAVRAWSARHPEAARAYAALRRARKNSSDAVPFTLQQLAARWNYYGNRCWICRDIATATDHVKPLSKGGAHMLCNLRPICKPCNSAKHNRWPFKSEMLYDRSA